MQNQKLIKFPLTKHKRGWCKKINGKVKIICGHVSHEDALAIWFKKKDLLLTSNTAKPAPAPSVQAAPQATVAALTTTSLKTKFIQYKQREFELGKLNARSFDTIQKILNAFIQVVSMPIPRLTADDFGNYRHRLAKKYCPTSIDRHVTNIKGMFRWAHRNGFIPHPHHQCHRGSPAPGEDWGGWSGLRPSDGD